MTSVRALVAVFYTPMKATVHGCSQPRLQPTPFAALLAVPGGGGATAVLSLITHQTDLVMIMAPYGATCVLLFSLAQNPLARPAHGVGEHLLATAYGRTVRLAFLTSRWTAGLTNGIATSLVRLLCVSHFPAGADPIVVFVADPRLRVLLTPVLLESVALGAMATLFYRSQSTSYPNV